LSRVGVEREQLLQQDSINNGKLNDIAKYRYALVEASSEKREVCINNYL
jgi:hypothetical protein